ncbi:anoctamin-4-like isoform X1 [Brachionus plicatilis]|uniref:Anoctamin n=1 Tax=Brachionus plicatilis TaxID=10195 RepID=A0A3M7P9W8_BRAPC|nr:anoctamin-4-like isoform X1 [Brachionus plicatilis]
MKNQEKIKNIKNVPCIIYNCSTISKRISSNIWNKNSFEFFLKDICDPSRLNFTICPICDQNSCESISLEENCLYSRIYYIFDNHATIVFSVAMSVWSVFFIEFWKRKQNSLQFEWDTYDLNEKIEPLRPQFRSKVTRLRPNKITKENEPYYPLSYRYFKYFISIMTIFFMVLVILGFIFGIVFYRTILQLLLYRSDDLRKFSNIIVPSTAAAINFVFIWLFGFLYKKIARWLTNFVFIKILQHIARMDYFIVYFLFFFVALTRKFHLNILFEYFNKRYIKKKNKCKFVLKEFWDTFVLKRLIFCSLLTNQKIKLYIYYIANFKIQNILLQTRYAKKYHEKETNYKDSLAIKIYLFEFVNTYGTLFYIAFIKGRNLNLKVDKYDLSERCHPAGCLVDLTIQVFIFMTGKQIVNNLVEVVIPFFKKWFRRKSNMVEKEAKRWEKDNSLARWSSDSIFDEYQEMTSEQISK